MTLSLILACLLLSPADNVLWLLRAGYEVDSVTSGSTIIHAYRGGSLSRIQSDRPLLPLKTALLIWNGDPAGAIAQWRVGSGDAPATRDDLLGALVWYGRTELIPHLGLGYPAPPDMTESRYPSHSEAVLRLGWMARMPDHLFHPEFRLGRADLMLLSPGYQGVPGKSDLDDLVRAFFR